MGQSLLHVDEVSTVVCILGGFIILFGLVSFFVKERLYLSEALVSVIVGIILGPIALGLLDPLKWGPSVDVTFEFTRIVIAIQVMFSGVGLPKAYLAKQWRSLLILLLPVMIYMWAASGLIIWWIIPQIDLLQALAIAACVTPTDPILANSVVKGRFAEKHVPFHVRNVLAAESGSNDGLAYPFLFLSMYLMKNDSVGKAIGEWILFAWLYQVALSCVIGIIVGYIARKLLFLAEEKQLIDKESFLVFAIALALFLMGMVAIIGSNDLFACFMAGTVFSWDDWFRKETEEAHLQEVIDMLLNLAIFIYIGAIIPWSKFQDTATGLTVWRLVVCAILILIFRRLPIVLALMKFIPALKTYREAAFTGWFGPIGVGAIYYMSVIKRHFGLENENFLYMTVEPVVHFLVMSSILVHGITIPLVKISKRINTLNTRSLSLTGTQLNSQVARLPLIRFGADIKYGPKTNKETPSNDTSPNDTSVVTIPEETTDEPVANTTGHEENNKEKQKDREEEEEIGERHNIDIPEISPDLIEQDNGKRPTIARAGRSDSSSRKYSIWDEGDSYIIENDDGEDIHVIPRSRKKLGSPGPSTASSPIPSPQQEQSRIRGFFNRGNTA